MPAYSFCLSGVLPDDSYIIHDPVSFVNTLLKSFSIFCTFFVQYILQHMVGKNDDLSNGSVIVKRFGVWYTEFTRGRTGEIKYETE